MLQRSVIIIGAAFAGAWTALVGGSAGRWTSRARKLLTSSAVSVLYPLGPARGEPWVPFTWNGLGLAGTLVQLGRGGGRRK